MVFLQPSVWVFVTTNYTSDIEKPAFEQAFFVPCYATVYH
jgi:hypothetical protein